MDRSTKRIFQKTCAVCQRPALTLDHKDRALCVRHATVFIADTRSEATDREQW